MVYGWCVDCTHGVEMTIAFPTRGVMPPHRVAARPAAAPAAASFQATLEKAGVTTPAPAAASAKVAAPAVAATTQAAVVSASLAPVAAPKAAQPSAIEQQIYSAIMGGYYAGSNNPNYSFKTGVAQGGPAKTEAAGAALADAQDAYWAAARSGNIAKAHEAVDQINTVRASIGLNAWWSPMSDYQILQCAGGAVGDAARAYADMHPEDCQINQFVNTGSAMLRNGGTGNLVQFTGTLELPAGLREAAT